MSVASVIRRTATRRSDTPRRIRPRLKPPRSTKAFRDALGTSQALDLDTIAGWWRLALDAADRALAAADGALPPFELAQRRRELARERRETAELLGRWPAL